MRKYLSLFLAALLVFSLTGCSFGSGDIIEPVEFFYQMRSDPSTIPDQVIGSEIREASGHAGDLNYLLSLYLRGPLDENLKAPFPAGCRLLSAVREDDTLTITLDEGFASLENIQLTVACACLAKTCFGMTDAAQVEILAEDTEQERIVNMTIKAGSLLLEDDGSIRPSAEETQ